MERTWSFGGSQRETVVLQSDLAHGMTVWRNGSVVVDDASWAVQRSYRIPSSGTTEVRLSIRRAWPFRTQVSLTVGGREVVATPRAVGARQPRRAILWWGRAASALSVASILLGLLNTPFAILFSFAALRAGRGARSARRAALAGALGLAPWAIGVALNVAVGLPGGARLLREGGWTMLPLIVVGFTAIALAIAHAIQAHARSAIRFWVVAGAVAASGAYLTHRARAELDEALVYASPADQEAIRAIGDAESGHAQRSGLSLAACALAIGAIGEIRRMRRRDGAAPCDPGPDATPGVPTP